MKKLILILIQIVFYWDVNGESLKITRSNDVFKLRDVRYFVSNPRYLRRAEGAYDTTNAMYICMGNKIIEKLEKKKVQKWDYVPDETMGRKMTVGFNVAANKTTGIVDSLPYTSWEYCKDNNISVFVAFYMYIKDQSKDLKDGTAIRVDLGEIPMSTTPEDAILNMILYGTDRVNITIPIDLSNVQLCMAVYDVPSNKCIFFRRTDDDDYVSLEEIVDELFQKL